MTQFAGVKRIFGKEAPAGCHPRLSAPEPAPAPATISRLDPFGRRRCARLNEQPRRDSTQSRKPRRNPDHRTVAAYEGFGDRMLNDGVGIVSGCKLRPGSIHLSTNVGEQCQPIERSIQ
jgi:hypothetical protein